MPPTGSAARFQRATIGVSAELCGYLRQAYPGRPVYHIPNGIDPDLVRQEALLPCSYPRATPSRSASSADSFP